MFILMLAYRGGESEIFLWCMKLFLQSIKLAKCFLYFCDKRAVYTCIKNPESFVHSGFSWEVARQLPLNTAKNPNRKTHLRSRIFWNSQVFRGFCQCKHLLQSRRYYSGFWSRVTWPSAESPDRGPRRNAHYTCTCTVKGREKSRMRTTYQKNPVWDSGFFAHALFVPKTPNVMGFSGSVNGTTKNPGFLDFGFCQCKWAYFE